VAVIGTRLRVAALRLGFRAVFGLPRSVKRLLAGPQVRVEDQGLDLDVQLLYRIGSLLSRREGGALDQATLAEQRRQADLSAHISADLVFDEIRTRDLEVDGAAGPRPARLYEPEALAAPGPLLIFFHGGGFALGSLTTADPLCRLVAAQAQLRVLSVSYRLAPEHPYPAAVDDALAAYEALLHNGTAPSDIAFAGESAGGGLAVATLVNARDHGLALPAAAFVMSPYADLTLAGTTMDTKHAADPLLSRESLQSRVPDYTSGQDASLGLISPIFADLSGLPPLIIQAGTHEVLLDDAVRLARQAAVADGAVTLDITPGVPHVFQAYYPILDEAGAALDRAGQLLSAHLASAERVTA